MFKLGEAVILTQDEERSIGEIVGVLRVSDKTYYDVSLERIVIKAAEQDEVEPVAAHELKGALTALVGTGSPTLSCRDVLLQQRYAAFLAQALASLEGDVDGDTAAAGHAVGDLVAVHLGDAYSVGVVQGIFRQGDAIAYEVETMGEVERLEEGAILDLESSRQSLAPLLGTRVRLAVSGHEDDEAYAGTVCSVEITKNGNEYSIQFDDGDILGGLDASDLISSTISDKDGVAYR